MNNEDKKKNLFVIAGWNDYGKPLYNYFGDWAKNLGYEMKVHEFGFFNKSLTYQEKKEKLWEKLSLLDGEVDLLGTSGGGPIASTMFMESPRSFNKVILFRSPLQIYKRMKLITDAIKKHDLITAIREHQSMLKSFPLAQRKRVMTLAPLWDPIVPPQYSKVPGAVNESFKSVGHFIPYYLGTKEYKRKMKDFYLG